MKLSVNFHLPYKPLAIPSTLGNQTKGWTRTLAYSHSPETATWRLCREQQMRYLKLASLAHGSTLAHERDRMLWAADRLPVPRVLDYGVTDGVEWLLTTALPGVDATDKKLRRDPAQLVKLLGHGLRAFHETPAQNCPYSFRLENAMAHVRRRVERGLIDPDQHFHKEHRMFTPAQALSVLESTRPITEDVVLCHGDYCLPNILIRAGLVSGYVDLGGLGAADRWWDLAVATWSVTWNLGTGWEHAFLQSYGIDPDPQRMCYFRLLYDLAS